MQTSKGTDFRDLSEDLEGVPPEDRAADALFPVKTTFGTMSTSLDQIRSMTRADASVKSCNPASHYGYLSYDGLDEDVWFAGAAVARRQPEMCSQEEESNAADQNVHVPNPQIRKETAEVIQHIPQDQIPDHTEEEVVDEIDRVSVPCASGAEQSKDVTVWEIREHFAFGKLDKNQSVQAECFNGRCHVCLTAQTKG